MRRWTFDPKRRRIRGERMTPCMHYLEHAGGLLDPRVCIEQDDDGPYIDPGSVTTLQALTAALEADRKPDNIFRRAWRWLRE